MQLTETGPGAYPAGGRCCSSARLSSRSAGLLLGRSAGWQRPGGTRAGRVASG